MEDSCLNDAGQEVFFVKTFNDVHTCVREPKNKNVNSKWIGKKLGDVLRVDPRLDYEVMRQML